MDKIVLSNLQNQDAINKAIYKETSSPNLNIFDVGTIVILKHLRNQKLEPHVFRPYKIISFVEHKHDFVIIQNL